jgi:rubrerythrin
MAKERRYKCEQCNFGWAVQSEDEPKRCPYCGRNDKFGSSDSTSSFTDVEDMLR